MSYKNSALAGKPQQNWIFTWLPSLPKPQLMLQPHSPERESQQLMRQASTTHLTLTWTL